MEKKKSCEKCEIEFEDGDVAVKSKDKFYHYSPPISSIYATMSCCGMGEGSNKDMGVFYKKRFYNLMKNKDKWNGINIEFIVKQNEKGFPYGNQITNDLSFLNNFEAD